MRCLGILGLTFLALLPVRGTADAPSLAIGDLATMRAAAIAKLKARPDCLAWYDFPDPVPEGFRFVPGPGKGTLTLGDGRWPGQRALRIYHGKLLRKEIHIPDSGFTLCFWLRVNGLEKVDRHGHRRIAGGVMAVGSGYYRGWRLLVAPVRSSVTFELGRPEIGARSLSSAGQLTSDEWHHVAVTWDHETMAMWIDGTLRAE
ncbi:MAG: LamG domain-containing protein, partial [Victivallales bacterium]|nr:LamG domain-containing protein [Victivallales bacterium]